MRLMPEMTSDELHYCKILTFVHQHSGGQEVYTIVVPGDAPAPSMTIGGSEPVEDHPEEWALYQKYIRPLGIAFDESDDQEFLTCHAEPTFQIKVFDPLEL